MKKRQVVHLYGRDLHIYGIIFSLLILFSIFGNDYLYNIIIIMGLFSIVTVGLSLSMGYGGMISVGQAAFWGIGAYTSGILSTTYGWNPWLTIPVAILFSGLIGLIVGLPSVRLHGLFLTVMTLGIAMLIDSLIIELRSLTGGSAGFVGIPDLTVGSISFRDDLSNLWLVWGILFVVVWCTQNITNSRTGRALRILSVSDPAAQAVGVNTHQFRIVAFVLSTMYAGLSGSLYAFYINFLTPTNFGISVSVELLMMIVFGGMVSVWGSILGVVILVSLKEILRIIVPLVIPGTAGEFEIIVYGLLVVAILIYHPLGIYPWIKNKLNKVFVVKPSTHLQANTKLKVEGEKS